MNSPQDRLVARLRRHHFELKHVLVLFSIMVASQVLVSFVQKNSVRDFLVRAQEWYQRDSAERFANLAAISLELLLETASPAHRQSAADRRKLIQAFDIIFSQQLLLQHVEEACVLVAQGERVFAIDNGTALYRFFFENPAEPPPADMPHREATRLYRQVRGRLESTEQVCNLLEGRQTFHVFVPFVPKGEYAGAVYIKNAPDFGFVTREIITRFNQSGMVFMGMILFGMLALFFVSSYSVQERDEAQQLLFKEREAQLRERIHYQKEAQFAKRIYHTHHKAEKVMGFIKEDVRMLSTANIEEIKYRVTKYANYISRVIYDMKWYEPPVLAIRGPIFQTDLNEVLRFIVEHICLRLTRQSEEFRFEMDLDPALPPVQVNEFVVWEIFEPLLQNALDHSGDGRITITVRTRFEAATGVACVVIANNGRPILPELLETNEHGIKRLFLENISTKGNGLHSGYGCYLAYEISKQRCGWDLDAENLPGGGCQFTLRIPPA
ncbi:MAG: ATP-binding protein [candidate division KSB1 bacterium]|nr:ATP-binding protein [candidate division KSB1 bacterium]MDZ7276274.1 ATP-binding protein [candidate division KSB1 bacterium]MDZ7287920.1 ATP-binding protein [candidate division KSB1 bacterium]MDZ7300067.1 ATP-binding protein [candidate division KSB1 bacterium]MDZ7307309.1 ATP-binding protein [candidate division KSB1 bacterium]